MKAYIITLLENEGSVAAANRCIESHGKFGMDFPIEIYGATRANQVETTFKFLQFDWTYPWDTPKTELKYGLKLSPYNTVNRENRMACFLSHYGLWMKCVSRNEPILILEHDAIFVRRLNPEYILESKYGIIGLNDPLGATRRADVFDSQIQTMRGVKYDEDKVLPVPTVDVFDVPQGLAGNSAYIIKPEAAQQLLDVVKELGAWPNDAIMCRQTLPGVLGVTGKYYTKVQGTKSTTSL
jgi:GR25 family glycosyltransferase involved in LPS biosynthesis